MSDERPSPSTSAREAQLEAIVSAVPDIIFELDENGTYLETLTANPDLLMRDQEELKGRRVHDFIAGDLADKFLGLIGDTLASGVSHTIEYQLDVKVGMRWFEGRTARVDSPDRDSTVVFLTRDITLRKEAEIALHESTALLESQNLKLRQVLDGMGYQLPDQRGAG